MDYIIVQRTTNATRTWVMAVIRKTSEDDGRRLVLEHSRIIWPTNGRRVMLVRIKIVRNIYINSQDKSKWIHVYPTGCAGDTFAFIIEHSHPVVYGWGIWLS